MLTNYPPRGMIIVNHLENAHARDMRPFLDTVIRKPRQEMMATHPKTIVLSKDLTHVFDLSDKKILEY